MRSKFTRHLVLWIVVSLVIEVIVLPLFLNPQDTQELIAREMRANAQVLGSIHAGIVAGANDSFNSAFIASGVLPETVHTFSPGAITDVFGVERVAARTSGDWIRSVWLAVYLSVYRLQIALYWFMPAMLFGIAAAIDGAMRRQINKVEFGVSDPIYFSYATHALIAVVGVSAALAFAPFHVHMYVWPLAITLACAILWVFAANFQAGVSGVS